MSTLVLVARSEITTRRQGGVYRAESACGKVGFGPTEQSAAMACAVKSLKFVQSLRRDNIASATRPRLGKWVAEAIVRGGL